MKRIISFSLYGALERYTLGAIRNVQLAPIQYPGWICRFYVDDAVPDAILEELRAGVPRSSWP